MNFKSKFLEKYKIVMEAAQKEVPLEVIELQHKINNEYANILNDENLEEILSKGEVALAGKNLDDYEPIISGAGTIKIVPNGLRDKSIIKASNITPNSISIGSIKNKKDLSAFFYLLKMKREKDSSFEVPMRCFGSLDAETKQINDLNQKIDELGGEITVKATGLSGNEVELGPFDEAKKVPGTPKADAKLESKNGGEDLYISLKDGGKAGEFRQYGGKTDLGTSDTDVLEKNPFIYKCYRLIKLLFDKLAFNSSKVIKGDYDFKYLRNNYVEGLEVSDLAFKVPTNDKETMESLLKTKFGKNFSDGESNINNVDVLMDGKVNLNPESGNEVEIKGTHHTEWNPLKYKNDETQSSNHREDLYDFVVNFIRYNANDEDAKTNQLSFADFKHCRFQIYPNKNQMVKDVKKTQEVFEKFGLGEEFKELYNVEEEMN